MLGPAILTVATPVAVPSAATGFLKKPSSSATNCLLLAPTKFKAKRTSAWLSQSCVPSRKASFSLNVAATDSSAPAPAEKEEAVVSKKYHFVVANAKFMLDDEEHFQELMFERLRHYGDLNKERDFWLVIEPKFLDKFPKITSRLSRPAVALVSTNASWITYMKLRLDRVLADSYEADTVEEALASKSANLEFEKPQKWVAPYPKYESGWWEPFLLSGSGN